MTGRGSIGRVQAVAFALGGILLVLNVVILVSYSFFYESRVKALVETQRELEKQRDEAVRAVAKVQKTADRLSDLRARLDQFYGETLGSRRERLAPLIDDIYSSTKKAGFTPDSMNFSEDEVPGGRRISITFSISGHYADIKRLMGVFETDPIFLVLESVGIGSDEIEPDLLKVNLVVAHYFRDDEGPATGPRPRTRSFPARVKQTTTRTVTRSTAIGSGRKGSQ